MRKYESNREQSNFRFGFYSGDVRNTDNCKYSGWQMSKKCKTSPEQSSRQPVFTRHRWQADFTCERCGKTRNPQAGLKMFRPIKITLDSTSTLGLSCPSTTAGEQQ